MLYIFHHNDPDGYFSAATICNLANLFKQIDFKIVNDEIMVINDNITTISCKHPQLPDHENITIDDDIIIVDYTPKTIEHLEVLLQKSKSVTLIDHHESTNKVFENYTDPKFTYHYSTKVSACELVYEKWFKVKPPKVIKLVSDYDNWNHKYEESTFLFYGIIDVITSVQKAYELLVDETNLTEIYITKGNYIFNFILNTAKQLSGVEHTLKHDDVNYDILIKNTHMKGSTLFTPDEQSKYDILCLFSTKDLNNVYFSFYTIKDNVNVGKILSEKNLGGGHKGAAGGKCDINNFKILLGINNEDSMY
jgi:nanoRNase/pAp phosphatase (c-di-AMP/oligoRNAs hydrolase)